MLRCRYLLFILVIGAIISSGQTLKLAEDFVNWIPNNINTAGDTGNSEEATGDNGTTYIEHIQWLFDKYLVILPQCHMTEVRC